MGVGVGAVSAEVRRVIKTQDGKYDALLSVVLGDRRYYIIVAGLARTPKTARVQETESLVRLELLDQFDHGFLTCVLDRRYFDEEFASLRCAPGSAWIVSEETLLRHRQRAEAPT